MSLAVGLACRIVGNCAGHTIDEKKLKKASICEHIPVANMPLTTIRPLLRTAEAPRRLWQASQRRGAQVVVHRDQRFFQTAVEPQVLARYREKLEKKQQRCRRHHCHRNAHSF